MGALDQMCPDDLIYFGSEWNLCLARSNHCINTIKCIRTLSFQTHNFENCHKCCNVMWWSLNYQSYRVSELRVLAMKCSEIPCYGRSSLQYFYIEAIFLWMLQNMNPLRPYNIQHSKISAFSRFHYEKFIYRGPEINPKISFNPNWQFKNTPW